MSELTPMQFEAFFEELHGYGPFPWQRRLAVQVCNAGWPGCLDLPTASGKTACIDVAVFTMAVNRRGPRRIFFVVDRRVVVDAAFDRMQKIADKLRIATGGILRIVADRLREMAGCDEPLDTYELRGGIYRDDSWVRGPLQPTLIASTVDQVGSRLLFRGYGVGDKVLSIHAGLVANDSVIFLDEAHCSQPFSATLAEIQKYRGRDWCTEDIETPFAFVEMTATPVGQGDERFVLGDDDLRHPEMRKRLYARKPARLIVSNTPAKDSGKLVEKLVDEALKMTDGSGVRRIAIIVNRVRTARLIFAALETLGHRAHLLIGRMRPIDRSELPPDLISMLSGKPRTPDGTAVFVVATQCLEVGADLDFDAIVTECASVDSLLQRFGRLDRIGDLHESGVASEGCVVISAHMASPKYLDPVYASALTNTWLWLNDGDTPLDFGICSEPGNLTVRERLQGAGREAEGLRRHAPISPLLLPSHLDALVQTSPRPALEPDVSLYLHGAESNSPEVQVVWRADLDVHEPELWAEIVALCPPVSTEAMTVPLRDFRAWLTNADESPVASDIEGIGEEHSMDDDGDCRCPVLRWQGDQSDLIEETGDLHPGDTLVLASSSGGWNELGHIPSEAKIDVAERARLELRRGWVLRLHPALIETWPQHPARESLLELVREPDPDKGVVLQTLTDYKDVADDWLAHMLACIPKATELDAYPCEGESSVGWVLSAQFVEADSGQDESSAASPVFLSEHLQGVANAVDKIASVLIKTEPIRQSLKLAAQFHDYGKADIRFQALLHGGDPMAAQFAPRPLAKGAQARHSREVRKAQWERSGLPDGFRHELISLHFAQQESPIVEQDLLLHLIVSHHGRCRPFAPVVNDDGGDLTFNGTKITGNQRILGAAHRLDSGVSDRFWSLTRRYGWWGLAYLESLLRLGDWSASAQKAALEEKSS